MISDKYDWGRAQVRPGFYMAIEIDNPESAVVAYVIQTDSFAGVSRQTGNNHCSYCGHPNAVRMSEVYLMWARLPDPIEQ